MTYEASARRIKHIAQGETTGEADIDYMLRTRTIHVQTAADAAAADATNFILMRAEKDCVLKSVHVTPAANVVEDDTDYITVDLNKEDGAAGGLTSLDSFTTEDTGGEDLDARVPLAFTIVESTDTLDAGEILVAEITKAASGKILPDCCWTISYEYV
jgi:hypothetical protein